jgi:hypothetical protein
MRITYVETNYGKKEEKKEKNVSDPPTWGRWTARSDRAQKWFCIKRFRVSNYG